MGINVAFMGALKRPMKASGGTVIDLAGERVHNFSSTSDFVVEDGWRAPSHFAVLAGGGGGGSSNNAGCSQGSGGWGGQLVTSFDPVQADGVLQPQKYFVPGTYPATVGGGGGRGGDNRCQAGGTGGTSSFDGISCTGGRGGRLSSGAYVGQPVTNSITGTATSFGGYGGATNVPNASTRDGPSGSGRGGTGSGWWYTAGNGGSGRVVVRYERY